MSDGQHDIDELRTVLERRIHRLQVQKATFGLETPPHILEDLEQAERDLAGLTIVSQPRISPEVLDAVPPSERERATFAALLDLMEQVAALKREFAAERDRDYQDRIERQRSTDVYRLEVSSRLGRLWLAFAANVAALGWLIGRRTR